MKIVGGSNAGTYYFFKNLEGDIIGIYNSSGTVVARYFYLAYGHAMILNPDYTQNGSASFIGNVNPFRYRGYYYDIEINKYYLMSRYYDQTTGRFINADSARVLGIGMNVIGGTNLFAYCLNNPIMETDPSGHFVFSTLIATILIGALVGAVINGGIEVGKQIYNNGWNAENWDLGAIGVSALAGAVSGALFALTGVVSSVGLALLIGGFSGLSGNLISQVGMGMINGQTFRQSVNINRLDALVSFDIGAVAGVVSYGLVKLGNNINKHSNDIMRKAMQERVSSGLNPISEHMINSFYLPGKLYAIQRLTPALVRGALLGGYKLF